RGDRGRRRRRGGDLGAVARARPAPGGARAARHRRRNAAEAPVMTALAACTLHLSHGERSPSHSASKTRVNALMARRVRGYGLSRLSYPLTPTLSPSRAFTPVVDGLWGRGSLPCLWRAGAKSFRSSPR